MTQTTTPALMVEQLSYTYPEGTCALQSVSFSLAEGEKVALVGPNGAGKSTLLLLLNGLLTPTTGSVFVRGERVEASSLRKIREQLGLVFQNPDDQLFCPAIYEDVAFGPRCHQVTEAEVEGRVRAALAAVGFRGDPARHAFHLSLGEKKRVSIATVLAMQVSILALDEPTAFLDPRGRREMLQLLGSLGGTQLVVTHDLDFVSRFADRVIALQAGRLVASGAPAEILKDEAALDRLGLL